MSRHICLMWISDLSYTSLKRLPSNGLDKLVVLRLLRTPSLKEIPSIYHLKSIKEAHLTYAFHCCAFRYPTHHDPIGFAQLKENIKKSYCEQNKTKDDLIDKVCRFFWVAFEWQTRANKWQILTTLIFFSLSSQAWHPTRLWQLPTIWFRPPQTRHRNRAPMLTRFQWAREKA